jgi:hypothetical protein
MPGSIPTCPTVKPRRYRGIRQSAAAPPPPPPPSGGPIEYNGVGMIYNAITITYNQS